LKSSIEADFEGIECADMLLNSENNQKLSFMDPAFNIHVPIPLNHSPFSSGGKNIACRTYP